MPTHPSHHDPTDGPPGPTRTRLPEGGTAPRRPTVRPSRTLVTVVGVFVLLIAALAFATRGGSASGGSAAGGSGANPQATAPTGIRPVGTSTDGIPTGFPRTAEGAQSAAANYAVTLGGEGMFSAGTRHQIDDALYTPSAVAAVKAGQDKAYTTAFLKKVGLDATGQAPTGMTFVSRVIPVGTDVQHYSADQATVAVWYTGLIGIAGTGSTNPVHTDWLTWTFHLAWVGSDWKIAAEAQSNGPAPIPGDDQAASADAISQAVSQFGGFTYAR